MSCCNSLCDRLAARMDSGQREHPQYARLKPKLLGTLEGEVVEIGPGPGVNLTYYPDAVRWTGVEPNAFLHEWIRQRAAELGTTVRVMAGSAEHFNFPDESVDAVVGTLVLCSVNDQDRALAEVLRVLKPRGRYVFIEHIAAPRGTGTRRIQGAVTPFLRRLPSGCSMNRETQHAIDRAGFDAVIEEPFDVATGLGFSIPHIAGSAIK